MVVMVNKRYRPRHLVTQTIRVEGPTNHQLLDVYDPCMAVDPRGEELVFHIPVKAPRGSEHYTPRRSVEETTVQRRRGGFVLGLFF